MRNFLGLTERMDEALVTKHLIWPVERRAKLTPVEG